MSVTLARPANYGHMYAGHSGVLLGDCEARSLELVQQLLFHTLTGLLDAFYGPYADLQRLHWGEAERIRPTTRRASFRPDREVCLRSKDDQFVLPNALENIREALVLQCNLHFLCSVWLHITWSNFLCMQCMKRPEPIGVGYAAQYIIKPVLGYSIAKVKMNPNPR